LEKLLVAGLEEESDGWLERQSVDWLDDWLERQSVDSLDDLLERQSVDWLGV
jgi:hypothetical protein